MIMYTDSVNLTDVAVNQAPATPCVCFREMDGPADSFQHLIMHQTSGMTMNSARKEINRLLNCDICHDGNTSTTWNNAAIQHPPRILLPLPINFATTKYNQATESCSAFPLRVLQLAQPCMFLMICRIVSQLEATQTPPKKEPPVTQQPVGTTITTGGIRIESIGKVPEELTATSNSMDLLNHAATNCLQHSSYHCNDIGLLVYCGVYRSEYLLEPAYASLLAGVMDMNATTADGEHKKTLAFDIFNGSLGFLNACYVAQHMLVAGHCEAAMIVAAESENNAADGNSEQMGIFETASAIILDRHPSKKGGFSRFLFRYHPEAIHTYATYCDTSRRVPSLRIKKDTGLQALYTDCIVPAVQEILQMEGLQLSQIAMVFPPQLSSEFINGLCAALDLPKEKFIDVVPDEKICFHLPYPTPFRMRWRMALCSPAMQA
jgi:3-oxoacyl-[acyl-carrier-protein] synthase III